MDRELQDRLLKISEQITQLKSAELTFHQLSASEKSLAGQLFIKAQGKSIADRQAAVYASDDWVNFTKGLAEAQTIYNYERRKYELLIKAYDAAHISYKIENQAIVRQK